MRRTLKCKVCILGLVLIAIFSFAISANARGIVDCTCGEENCSHDFGLHKSYRVYFEVVEEIDAEYKVCYTELIHELSLDAFTPICFAIESKERAMQFLEPKQWYPYGGIDLYDYDSKNEQYPESLRDILSSYNETFYENNFLWVAYHESSRTDTPRISRLDVAKSTDADGREVLVTLVDCSPDDTDVMYWIVIELPKKYLAYTEDHFEMNDVYMYYYKANPKTGDSVMLVPAVGVMVAAAAGIVITKKRRK